MSQKEIVVQGATCECQFGTQPDKLKVLTQEKHYVNDMDGSKKLIASHVDTGMTFEKNTFGNCKLQPSGSGYLPCVPKLTKWTAQYEDMVLVNNGQVLVEDSKGICAISGSPCIKISKTGQKGSVSSQNIENADEKTQSQVNPLVNMKDIQKKDIYEFLNAR
ncbi:DUF4280 domain-containing protein [Pedobacter sp. SYP-B3415]|uniref:DUF4280 domain-containing protein n=1 Tax=Pedobacter sp. SYP-B3415 TaxID=2496641 RepID=UPI00101CB782|nr:DUF4280 domain-containing protein [Pedobacter sp. SYP-B3415]